MAQNIEAYADSAEPAAVARLIRTSSMLPSLATRRVAKEI